MMESTLTLHGWDDDCFPGDQLWTVNEADPRIYFQAQQLLSELKPYAHGWAILR